MSSEYLCNPLHYVEAMKHKYPQLLRDWCCTELSHVLDFSGTDGLGQVLAGEVDIRQGKTIVKKFSKIKQRANSQSGVFGAQLNEEGYCQARQLIDFLKDYLTKEGIFRIPGNSERQRRLKDKISSGLLVDLGNYVFTPHDVACVLKTFLGDLPEPLLTDKHYPAHVQAAALTFQMDEVPSLTASQRSQYCRQQTANHITALRYLFLMLPPVYLKLLRELLDLLHSITENERDNKMTAFNLGVMFAPHILWPRYLTADDLRDQTFVNKLNCGVEFMITNFHQIFKVPAKMLKRCEQFIKHGNLLDEDEEPKPRMVQDVCDGRSKRGLIISGPQVGNVKLKKEQTQTEAALAQLYARVQEMPPGPKKRKLMKQFAKNSNMPGTPTQVKAAALMQSQPHQQDRQTRHLRSKSAGDTIVKHTATALQMKKRRRAPQPPVDNEMPVQRANARDTRPEMQDHLRRSRAISCTTPPTTGPPTPKTAANGAPSRRRPVQSPGTPRQTPRQPPLTPRQIQEILQNRPTGTDGVSPKPPMPAVRASKQPRKRRSDGEVVTTDPTADKPVPKPRRLQGESPESSHSDRHQRSQRHELHSLV